MTDQITPLIRFSQGVLGNQTLMCWTEPHFVNAMGGYRPYRAWLNTWAWLRSMSISGIRSRDDRVEFKARLLTPVPADRYRSVCPHCDWRVAAPSVSGMLLQRSIHLRDTHEHGDDRCVHAGNLGTSPFGGITCTHCDEPVGWDAFVPAGFTRAR